MRANDWQTVVHNDPVNLMTYVEWVFTSYFRMSHRRAHALMLEVHNKGRAVVSKGLREQMEADVQAMHTFGLWATIEKVA
ncbi:MAG: ATP-dependent Clp protease adapter ClpS [Actinomycetaceae bacterium]|nr:ATP-dependent Clp protease adapter ClpS [Actinomycetaceae bacterium]